VNKNNFKIKAKGLIPLFFLLIFFGACKKESTQIGVGLSGDLTGSDTMVTYQNIITRTVLDDSLSSDNLATNILGVINDPIFGYGKASLVVEPLLTEEGGDFTNKEIDSVVLVLNYDIEQVVGFFPKLLRYGDMESELEIEVYQLQDTLENKRYTHKFNPTLGAKLGQFTGKFSFDSVSRVVDGESIKVAPQMSITLDNSFGTTLFNNVSSTTAFKNALKGLVLVPKSNPISGEGAIVGIEASNPFSGITVYYDDTLTKVFPLGSSSAKINLFETTPSGAIASQMSGTGHFNTTYAQSLGGTKIKVDIPELNQIIEMGEEIVINEASINFIVDASSVTSNYPVPSRLLLQIPDTTGGVVAGGKSIIFIDAFDRLNNPNFAGLANYGGDYSEGGYTFRFNRYLQQLVKEYIATGVNNFNGFYLSVPSDFPVTPARTVLNTDNTTGAMKVSITYTKLN
jgi:hypothetical protein